MSITLKCGDNTFGKKSVEKDVVCGMSVDPNSALKSEHMSTLGHACECLGPASSHIAMPSRYLKRSVDWDRNPVDSPLPYTRISAPGTN